MPRRRKNRRVILMDSVPKQNTHKLNKHRIIIFGDADDEKKLPDVFNQAVSKAFAGINLQNRANIVYLADILPSGTPKLIAKLYQAKYNVIGKAPRKKEQIKWGTFHYPDGVQLGHKAFGNMAYQFYERSDKVYPSRPPVPPGMNTLLRKLVKI